MSLGYNQRMKKKVIVMLLLSLSLVGNGRPVKREKAPGTGLFWKIQGKGITAHLLASSPLQKKTDPPLSEFVTKIFTDSPVLILMMHLPEDEAKINEAYILQKGMYIGEKTLKAEISAKTYLDMKLLMKEYGLEPFMFAKVKPWMASIVLTLNELKRLGYGYEEGPTYTLLAAGEKKNTIGLLQLSESIELLDLFSREESERYLQMNILACRWIQKNHEQLHNALINGDLAYLEETFEKQKKEQPLVRYFQNLFDAQHNRLIYSRLEKNLQVHHSCFMIFDVEALTGEKGVLNWLKKQGYQLTQIH